MAEARAHAILGASGSKKWLTCTPSARLEDSLPDDSSDEAKEGTKAHDLLEIVAKELYHGIKAPANLLTREGLEAAGFNVEMLESVREFLKLAKEITDPMDASGTGYTVLVEQRLDYSEWVPEGFGTGDLVVVAGHCIWVRDFKYGKGIPVASEENSQMMLYGLGAYNELAFAYDDIRELDIGIVQPRIHNNSSWRVTAKNLLEWGESIKPVAQLAWEGKGGFVPGSHCDDSFCRARYTCKARASACLEASAALTEGDLLLAEEIAALLPKLPAIEKWAKGLREYANKSAVEQGVEFPGYKLVEDRSNRFISDTKLASVRLVANGYPMEKIFSEPKLLGITALEDLLGSKKTFTELLGDIIVKPRGKPVLAPADDKRAEWKRPTSADEDFGD